MGFEAFRDAAGCGCARATSALVIQCSVYCARAVIALNRQATAIGVNRTLEVRMVLSLGRKGEALQGDAGRDTRFRPPRMKSPA
jgi:hypothetical protein